MVRTGKSQAMLLIVAQVLFAAVVVARFFTDRPGEAILLLLCVPIAMFAVVLGTWGGLAAAALGVVAFGLWDILQDADVGTVGYFTRAVAFFLLGGLVGRLSTLARKASDEDKASASELRRQFEQERRRADEAQATAENLAQLVVKERERGAPNI